MWTYKNAPWGVFWGVSLALMCIFFWKVKNPQPIEETAEKKVLPPGAHSFCISENGKVMAYALEAKTVVVAETGTQKEIATFTIEPPMEKTKLYLGRYGRYILVHDPVEEKVTLWNIAEQKKVPLSLQSHDIEFFTFELGDTEVSAHTSEGMMEIFDAQHGYYRLRFNRKGFLEKAKGE